MIKHNENCVKCHITMLNICSDMRVNYLPVVTAQYIITKELPCPECQSYLESRVSPMTKRLYMELVADHLRSAVEPYCEKVRVLDMFQD